MNRGRRVVLLATLTVIVGVFGVAAFRELSTGARAIEESDLASQRKDWPAAVLAAHAAAEAVLPGSPYPERGYERLAALARDAEARGDEATASDAWRAMRAATSATRALGVRTSAWRAMADEGLVRIARGGAKAAPDGTPAEAPRESALIAALQRDEPPATATFALLAVAAVAFFGGLGRIAWMAAKPLTLRRVGLSGAVAAMGLALYLVVSLRG